MSKYTQKRIDEIKNLTTVDIPNAIKNEISVDEYLNKYRMTLNLTIIQAVFGCEFDKPKKKDNYKVKFNHKLPTSDELATITRLINDFVTYVENPFLAKNYSNNECAVQTIEDMEIPVRCEYPNLPELEKVNSKKINEYIFGNNAISMIPIGAMDIVELAAVAEKIKKVKTRNRMLLIGGIAIVLTGGAIATAAVVRSKMKNKNAENDIDPDADLNEIDVDMSDIDVDDVMSDDDSPSVDFNED